LVSTFATVFASFSLYRLWKTCTFVQAFLASFGSDTGTSAVSVRPERPALGTTFLRLMASQKAVMTALNNRMRTKNVSIWSGKP
jgi:hypothetical protein